MFLATLCCQECQIHLEQDLLVECRSDHWNPESHAWEKLTPEVGNARSIRSGLLRHLATSVTLLWMSWKTESRVFLSRMNSAALSREYAWIATSETITYHSFSFAICEGITSVSVFVAKSIKPRYRSESPTSFLIVSRWLRVMRIMSSPRRHISTWQS